MCQDQAAGGHWKLDRKKAREQIIGYVFILQWFPEHFHYIQNILQHKVTTAGIINIAVYLLAYIICQKKQKNNNSHAQWANTEVLPIKYSTSLSLQRATEINVNF